MQKEYRIRKNGQFQYVYRKGNAAGCRELTLLYVRAARLQVGFSVSKKVGGAVVRNKVKRRLRAAFRSQLAGLRTGYYVFSVKPAAAQADYRTLQGSMKYLLRRQNLYRNTDL
ncbi:MAG: ribonuclease P protein component [Clostridiales bacterium]|nr:ribonuclease P protein component [Clostridiales bacterium]